jgi:hypothetical protein
MNAVASLEVAATEVLRAADALRDARNGEGHPGEPHDKLLHMQPFGEVEVFDLVDDCSACGGAQYGTEYELYRAYGDLREALGQPRMAWEGAS